MYNMCLALIRHPALRVPPGICYGRRDYPLANPADVARVVTKLDGFRPTTVLASPAGRCRALAQAIPAADLRFDARLLELDFGRWEGEAWDTISRAELDLWAADPLAHAPPGGETGAALIARTTSVYEEIVASATDHAVVTHGGPLKVLSCLARGWPVDLSQTPPCFASVTIFNDRKPILL